MSADWTELQPRQGTTASLVDHGGASDEEGDDIDLIHGSGNDDDDDSVVTATLHAAQSHSLLLDNSRSVGSDARARNASSERLWNVLAATALVLVIAVIVMVNNPPPAFVPADASKGLLARHGAVASDNTECSQLGSLTLQRGGNAVDAAIATAFCLGVRQPFASGIGGGGFMLVHMANGSSSFLDFRETAPAAATKQMFYQDPSLAVTGPLAAGVPGEVAGLHRAYQMFGGALPWADLVAPAAGVAHDGFPVNKVFAQRLRDNKDALLNAPSGLSVYNMFQSTVTGDLVVEGEKMRHKILSLTLSGIRLRGPSEIYDRQADAIAQDVQDAGGIISAADLRGYRVRVREPIRTHYHGLTVLGGPPASSGGPCLALALNILERYQLRVLGRTAEARHLVVEAMKHCFAHRTRLGDMDHVDVTEAMAQMTDKDFAAALRQVISREQTYQAAHYRAPFAPVEDDGTSHITVIDKDRNVVCLTSTINHSFGSKFGTSHGHIILNNQMDDFSVSDKPNSFGLPPSPANAVAPGKRPLSSMAPTIVLRDGKPLLAIGGSGGPTIITAVLQVLLDVVDYDRDVLHAVSAPRFHHQLYPNVLFIEPSMPESFVREMQARKHQTVYPKRLADGHSVGVVQAIHVTDDDMLHAASDPRKYGTPAGY